MPDSSVNRPWTASGTPDESTQEFPVPDEVTETQSSSVAEESKHESSEVAPPESSHESNSPDAAYGAAKSNHGGGSFQPTIAEDSTPSVAEHSADSASMGEAEQKAQKDARRFAKLLVSEIDLYNKAKVAEGRQNRDLYKRLRSDIDRSRLTFEKRFGKGGGQLVDYFHDELVKILAENDSARLGPEYPGPTM